jgi:hypothetical protein
MSLTTALAAAAPFVSNEVLGSIAQAFDPSSLGSALRPLVGPAPLTSFPVPVQVSTKSPLIPEDPIAKQTLLDTIYGAYTMHKRRSVGALSGMTGLTESAIMKLLEGNSDFEVVDGLKTDIKYIRLKGLK